MHLSTVAVGMHRSGCQREQCAEGKVEQVWSRYGAGMVGEGGEVRVREGFVETAALVNCTVLYDA